MITNQDVKYKLVSNAQHKLETQYTVDKLKKQVLNVFALAKNEGV